MLGVVRVDQFPAECLRDATLATAHLDAKGNEIGRLWLGQMRAHGCNRNVTRSYSGALDVDRLQIQQAEVANRFHDLGMTRVAKRLVFHRLDLAFVAEG